MPIYIALIRALNVGGTGKLPMEDLRAICGELGFTDVSTYIQSGNVILRADGTGAEVAARLDAALGQALGKPPGVFVRTPGELRAIVDNNPFPASEPNHVLVNFFDAPLPENALSGLVAPKGEEAAVLGREIYVHYPIGSGRSKFKLPVLKAGTSRNINTVAALSQRAAALENGG